MFSLFSSYTVALVVYASVVNTHFPTCIHDSICPAFAVVASHYMTSEIGGHSIICMCTFPYLMIW